MGKEICNHGYSIAETTRNLGINATLSERWKRESENQNNPIPGNPFALKEELRRLRNENKQLQMEREILKNAADFFAKESNWRLDSLYVFTDNEGNITTGKELLGHKSRYDIKTLDL